jgi:hypothetical protein
VRVTDGDGATQDLAVSEVSNALERLAGPPFDFALPKTYLRTLRIPLAALGDVDLRDIRSIDLLTNRVPTGSVFLSDLALVRDSLGRSGRIGVPRLSVNDVTIEEGDTGTQRMRFLVNLSRPTNRKVRVHVDAATDFFFDSVVTPLSQTYVMQPGQRTLRVTLTVNGNDVDNFDRVFAVVLSIPKEAIVDRSIGTGIVLDDDPTPTMQIGPASAPEGNGAVLLPLTLSNPTADGVFVDVTLADGTATLGADYGPEPFAFGFVEPGRTTGEVIVPVVDDGDDEPDETFTATVTGVFGATLTGPDTVTGTIVDDD